MYYIPIGKCMFVVPYFLYNFINKRRAKLLWMVEKITTMKIFSLDYFTMFSSSLCIKILEFCVSQLTNNITGAFSLSRQRN